MCICGCGFVCLSPVAHRGWTGVSKALELRLQAVMSWVLGTKLRCPARAVHVFDLWVISLVFLQAFLNSAESWQKLRVSWQCGPISEKDFMGISLHTYFTLWNRKTSSVLCMVNLAMCCLHANMFLRHDEGNREFQTSMESILHVNSFINGSLSNWLKFRKIMFVFVGRRKP